MGRSSLRDSRNAAASLTCSHKIALLIFESELWFHFPVMTGSHFRFPLSGISDESYFPAIRVFLTSPEPGFPASGGRKSKMCVRIATRKIGSSVIHITSASPNRSGKRRKSPSPARHPRLPPQCRYYVPGVMPSMLPSRHTIPGDSSASILKSNPNFCLLFVKKQRHPLPSFPSFPLL